MTKKKISAFIKEIYESISIELKEVYGKDYRIYIDMITESMSTKDFILTFNPDSYYFMITFTVGQMGKRVAEIMAIILSFIETNEIYIMDDTYFDKENRMLYHGEEAIAQKQLSILRQMGKDKCIICDSIYPIKLISDKKICKVCDKNYNEIAWC